MRTLYSKRLIAGAVFLSLPLALSAQDKEIKALATTVAESLGKTSKKTVAVVDFTDLQGNVTELGRYLAEEVSVALAGAGTGIEVVDRTHLKALLQENKLAATGVIDPATAMKLGRIAGVEILITGTITPFGDSVRFSVKTLDTTTARIISGSTTEIAKTRAIEELLSRGVAAGSPAGGGGPAGGAQNTLPPAAGLTSEAQELSFGLTSCRLSGGSITCGLTVLNKAEDRDLTVYAMGGPTRLIDGTGVEYKANQVQLAGVRSSYNATATLVTGVPTAAQVWFDGVPSSVSSIALLELYCQVTARREGSNKFLTFQFRAVPLAR